ncbi:MAG: hypothetical protein KGL39_07025 [Patescibacteria group bacterium]|nr:hypothetical protein [Patescibacteria group bacterium]
MSDDVTNGQIYGELIKISGTLGELKTSTALQLEAIKNHSGRITVLEGAANKQKGRASLVTTLVTAGSGIIGAVLGGWWQARH